MMTPEEADKIRREWLEELQATVELQRYGLTRIGHSLAPWQATLLKDRTERFAVLKDRIQLLESMNADDY